MQGLAPAHCFSPAIGGNGVVPHDLDDLDKGIRDVVVVVGDKHERMGSSTAGDAWHTLSLQGVSLPSKNIRNRNNICWCCLDLGTLERVEHPRGLPEGQQVLCTDLCTHSVDNLSLCSAAKGASPLQSRNTPRGREYPKFSGGPEPVDERNNGR